MNNTKYVFGFVVGVMMSLGGFTLPGCSHVHGSGMSVNEAGTVSPFNELIVSGHVTVHLAVGDNYSVNLYGDDNVVAATSVVIDDGALRIAAPKALVQTHPLEVSVVTPDLNRITAAITEDVTINMTGRPLEALYVRLSGVGRLSLHGLAAKTVTSHVDGTGTMILDGAADHLNFRLFGMGMGSFEKLCLKTAQVRVFGMGKVTVNAGESLDATVKGLGKVTYLGNPGLHRTVRGGGSVEPAGEQTAAVCKSISTL